MKQLRQSAAFAVAAWLVRALTFVLLVSAGTLFVVSVGIYATEIVLRGGFRTSFPEYYEIVGIAFIYVFLLGAAALYARNEDIIIDLVYARLPPTHRRYMIAVIYAAIVVTMLTIFIATVELISLVMSTPTPLLGVPEAIKWIPFAIASASIAFSSAVELWAAVIWIATGERPPVWREPFFDLVEQP